MEMLHRDMVLILPTILVSSAKAKDQGDDPKVENGPH